MTQRTPSRDPQRRKLDARAACIIASQRKRSNAKAQA
jgi:hypothetical protein